MSELTPETAASNDNAASARRLAGGQPINAPERRSRFVGVRFTPTEYARLNSQAEAARVEVSTFARAVLLDDTLPSNPRRKATADEKELARLLVQLGKIGSNLNQLARIANTTGEAASAAALQQIGREMAALREALREAMAA